jgi:uncharacterized protein involved in type VI secretion and phage assembly
MDRAAPQALLPAGMPPVLGPTWAGGVFLGQVLDVADPMGQGRVLVRVMAVHGDNADASLWARMVCPFAGDERGAFWIPDVGDHVAVAFIQGDPRFPVVLGGLWHGNAPPPHAMDPAGDNHQKVLRSRNGVQITLDDTPGQEQLVLETPGGCRLTLKDGPGGCEVVDSNGNSTRFTTDGITVSAGAKVTVEAAVVEVSAGMVTVNAGMSKFSGVVKCDTLITNAVISSSYTPGAGNIW